MESSISLYESYKEAFHNVVVMSTLHSEKTLLPTWFEEIGGETKLKEHFEGFKKALSCEINVNVIA